MRGAGRDTLRAIDPARRPMPGREPAAADLAAWLREHPEQAGIVCPELGELRGVLYQIRRAVGLSEGSTPDDVAAAVERLAAQARGDR